MASSSITGGCSGVAVHACVAAEAIFLSPTVAAETTPMRSDEALATRNFASAVSGDTQNQILPGALRPRAEDKREKWLIDAVDKAAWSGSSRGGHTPPPVPTPPMSQQMRQTLVTPPGTPGSFHPANPGMEDTSMKSEKKREAPPGDPAKSSLYMLPNDDASWRADVQRNNKSPRRVGQPDTFSLVSGAASKLSMVTGQSSSGVGSSWMMIDQPPGGLATLGGLSTEQQQLALATVGAAGIGDNTFPGTQVVSYNMASGEGSSALSRVQQEILKNRKDNLTKDWEAE